MTATILVADDAPSVRQLLRTVLTRAGYFTAEAATGPDTIRLVEQLRPAVLLLDLDLPIMDGYEVCEYLRTDPLWSEMKIVMVTAHSRAEDRRRAEQSGADAFIIKPFRPIALLATIAASLAGRAAPRSPRETRCRPAMPPFEVFPVGIWNFGSRRSCYGADLTSSNGT